MHRIHVSVFYFHAVGGAVLILEKMLSPNKDGPAVSLMFDLGLFLMQSEGRERSVDEYLALLEENNFSDVRIEHLPMCLRDAILGMKP